VPVGRRLVRLGRPVLAVGLLATLGWAALQGVHRSADATDKGRLADRLQVTQAAAASAGAWLDAGAREAVAVATQAAQAGPGQAATAYATRPHTFRDVFVVDRTLRRAAGNQRYAASDGSLLACRDAKGVVLDDGLRQLAQAALQTGGAVLRAFDDPSCAPVIAAAAVAASGPIAIAVADRSPFLLRLDALNGLANGRTSVLEPGGDAVGAAVAPASDELNAWVASRRSPAGAARVPRQGLVRAWAPLSAGWTLVVEQGSNEFGGAAVSQPSSWFPAAVAACFAVAILVVGIFDARRRRALARADVDRAAFLAIVGHELRTPLTVLKGFVDTVTARWDDLEERQRLSLIERLAPQVRRLHRAVDRLLVAADIQRGSRPALAEESVHVAEALHDVADGFRPLAPLHTFVLEADVGLLVKADRKALGQVLDQLVDNAVKYSPSGGVVALRAVRRRGRIDVTVEDEGVGLPSDPSRIFEAFTQGEYLLQRTLDEGGVGVGLFIVRTLVSGMGGTVRAERRTPEPGTRLTVTLVAGPSRPPGDEQLARSARVHGPS
jgi:signal transduction histidine kinase